LARVLGQRSFQEVPVRKGFSLSLFAAIFLCVADFSTPAQQLNTLPMTGSTDLLKPLHDGSFAVWSGANLIVVDDRFSNSPTFTTLDRDGNPISQFTLSIPWAGSIRIYDNSVAQGSNGSLAIIGSADSYDSGGGLFLALISPDHQRQTVIRTSTFFPEAVTIASDQTIWVAGHQKKPSRSEDWDRSQKLLRHYDTKGELLGSFIPWSSLQTDSAMAPTPSTESVLLPLADGIGWYSPGARAYIELSLDGSIKSQLKDVRHERGDIISAASCADGEVFVAISTSGEPKKLEIFSLDRQRGEWTLIPRNEHWGDLLGCDGTRLAALLDFSKVSWLETKGE
jgi:hypothetical protein